MRRSRLGRGLGRRAGRPPRPAPSSGPSPRAGAAGSCGRACGGRGRRGRGPRWRRRAGRPRAAPGPGAGPARPARPTRAPGRRRRAGRAAARAALVLPVVQGVLDQVVGVLDGPRVAGEAGDQPGPRRGREPPQAGNQPIRRNRASAGRGDDREQGLGRSRRCGSGSSRRRAAGRSPSAKRVSTDQIAARAGERQVPKASGSGGRHRPRPGRPGATPGCRGRAPAARRSAAGCRGRREPLRRVVARGAIDLLDDLIPRRRRTACGRTPGTGRRGPRRSGRASRPSRRPGTRG